MINLKKQIRAELVAIHPRVYSTKAPKDMQFPYVVFTFPASFDNEGMDIYNMDVDVWSNSQDTTELETITTNIWRRFNGLIIGTPSFGCSIHRETKQEIEDDDPMLHRRKMIFTIRYIE